MKIHEYQAKEILGKGGVAVPEGGVATTSEEARAVATRLGRKVVVKAQVHAGGRGKGGGVRLVRSREEVVEAAEAILKDAEEALHRLRLVRLEHAALPARVEGGRWWKEVCTESRPPSIA